MEINFNQFLKRIQEISDTEPERLWCGYTVGPNTDIVEISVEKAIKMSQTNVDGATKPNSDIKI